MNETMEELWDITLNEIKQEMPDESFELWFRPLKFISLENNILTLQCPNKFFSDWVKTNYEKKIEILFSQKAGQEIKLKYAILESLTPEKEKTVEEETLIPTQKEEILTPSDEFDPRYTFENFIVGSTSRFAQAAAFRVANEPGKAFNPLFIYGGVGLGKTHLLHAIGHRTKQIYPQIKVVYVTSEKFINEFINSLRDETLNDFRNRYRGPDCLLIDDIQFLIGKQRSEEEFFYTFNALYDSRRQIVVTSDRPPQEIPALQERLISRFEWGVVADIKPPDLETRIAILRKKAENEKLYVPDDVITFIAEQIQTNIRQLEGALIRVVAFASLLGTEISIDKAKEVLRDIITKREVSEPITIERIQKVVAKHFHLNPKEMTSKKRTDAVAFPRQIAMYLARNLTEQSTTEIGEAFGGRDHTTVMHACDKIKLKVSSDPYFSAFINKILEEIKST
jgi:chromosomal replication initiator protein